MPPFALLDGPAGTPRGSRSPALLWRRLLALDYVLEFPGLPWLPTEDQQVAHFEALGIARATLPQRLFRGALGGTVRYFPMGFPIAAGVGRRATFVFVDPGYDSNRPLERWADAHRPLWTALRSAGNEVVAAVVASSYRAEFQRRRKLEAWKAGGGVAPPVTAAKREMLRRFEAAMYANDGTGAGFEEWGGFAAARRRAAPIRRAASMASKHLPAGSTASPCIGRIDWSIRSPALRIRGLASRAAGAAPALRPTGPRAGPRRHRRASASCAFPASPCRRASRRYPREGPLEALSGLPS